MVKNGFVSCSIKEMARYNAKPFENGLMPLRKALFFNGVNFLFVIDKNGLLVSAKNLLNESQSLTGFQGKTIDLIEHEIKFQALTENELIEKCSFFVSVIQWKKIKTCLQLETVLNVHW